MSTAEIILNYANERKSFSIGELSEFVRDREPISDSGILWHIKRLIKENKIARIARGMYGKHSKSVFVPNITSEHKKLYHDLKKRFPLIDSCIYSGSHISSMQHHVSANNAIYLEVSKDATEAVFHWLLDNGKKAYHRPTENLMSEYVNLSDKCVIVKPLTTESPLVMVDGVPAPSLEKLLVDISKDADFYYLQGGEIFYIMDFARTFYHINEPKMLRYASRRGIRNEMIDLLNHEEHSCISCGLSEDR